MAVIELEALNKEFLGKKILEELSLEIPEGKMVALAGADGAGKTTLLRLIAGLLIPTQGKIRVKSQAIGYMPQKFGLYEDLTVIQNLKLYADLYGVVGEERQVAFDRLLTFTQLTPFTKRLAGNLSGGMKQKLGLACTLLHRPRILLLDEPSVGVDPLSRKELWDMTIELLKGGVTILWSTSYLDEAQKCDLALLLHEGKPLFYGSPKALMEKVEGRVFKWVLEKDNKRSRLFSILQDPKVVDAQIQGKDIRIVTKEQLPQSGWSSAEPRFEDAFIDMLGGVPKGNSKLAENAPMVQVKSEWMIEAEGLSKLFKKFVAVERVHLQVKSGEIFGLLGPNGAGKSTIFKMLCGLLKPTTGKALVNGFDLQKAPSEARSSIGYMAQKFSLYGDLSLMQNLIFFSGAYNLKGKEQKIAIQQMIDIFNFHPFLDQNGRDLPLGYKQRLALACSVLHHPEVLFLDEPTSGVDPITRREFWNHIHGLVAKKTTIMITTHFMDEAEYCDRIGLIYQGKIIHLGTPDDLKELAKASTLEEAFITLIEENHVEKD